MRCGLSKERYLCIYSHIETASSVMESKRVHRAVYVGNLTSKPRSSCSSRLTRKTSFSASKLSGLRDQQSGMGVEA
jgi:hypothetical protein